MDKKLVCSCFEGSASSYDSVAEVQKSSSRDLINLIDEAGAIDAATVSSIIDIGCGTGNTSLALQEKYPDAAYTLCDISEQMLEIAAQKFSRPIKTINCDAENYEFPQYDLAISNLCMQWFSCPCEFIERARKFFKRFAFSILVDSSFAQYKNYFEVPPIFSYPSIEELAAVTGKNYQIKKYCVEFENFFNLCRYFKKLGAHAKSEPPPIFKDNYVGKIILDYEVFLCVL